MSTLSILIPSIRTDNRAKLCESIEKACTRYKYEVLFVGPTFDGKLLKADKIRWIMEMGSPNRALQVAASYARNKYILNSVDDGMFAPGSIDKAMDQMEKLTRKDVVNLRYSEADTEAERKPMPMKYWTSMWYHPPLRLPGINKSFALSMHFLMHRDYYVELGGIDCIRYEYHSYAIHDLMIRLQTDGGRIIQSEVEGQICTHLTERAGDHGPVHDAQTLNDEPTFQAIYSIPDYKPEIRINFDNYKDAPIVWTRRFKGK